MDVHHIPVLAAEVVAGLQVRPEGVYVDCTIGEGGHTQAILKAVPRAHIIGIDLDSDALATARQRLEAYSSQVDLVQGNFADLDSIIREQGLAAVDGILFDLGISSMQVETPGRGFSFRLEGALDMRFDSRQVRTAYQVVNESAEHALADIIFRFGEEPRARQVARAIVRNRPIETTTQLSGVVAQTLGRPPGSRSHPATRTFQAIRMAVNEELNSLERGLLKAINTLRSGGRLVVISYHSLEDRLVKNTLRREASGCLCPPTVVVCDCGHIASIRLISRKVTKPAKAEVQANPRSRSARMRVAEHV